MAGEAGETTGAPTTGDATGPAPATAAPGAEATVEALQKKIAELNKESADRRVKAREAEEKATAAETAKAAEEGRWADVIAAKEKAAEALRQQIKDLDAKASKADRYASVIAGEVAALEAAIGEERTKSLAHISPEDRLPILKQFAALVTPAKGAAPTVRAGNPAGASVAVSIENMTPEQLREHVRGKSPEELRALMGIPKARGPFG